jgi:hypothetical protein
MRPRAAPSTAAVSPGVVRVVLLGWGAAGPLDRDDDDRVFELYQGRDAGIVRVWRAHEAFLRVEARRLGIVPAWTYGRRRYFFGEYLTRVQHDRAIHDDDDDRA